MGNAHATSHATAPAHGHDAHGHDAHGRDAHGHGHGADNGKVVAVVVIVLMIGLAVRVGRVLPVAGRAQPTESTRRVSSSEAPGIVVLVDGRILRGPVKVGDTSVSVGTDGGEVVVSSDPTCVRWIDTTTDSLTEEYWSQHAGEPLAGGQSAEVLGGGIVVLKSGKVLVGRIVSSASSVTVRWPYGESSFHGEVVVPRDDIRFLDTAHDALTEEYWYEHGDAPLDPAFRRATRGAQAPSAPASPRTRAELAQYRGDWEQAAVEWAGVYGETKEAADLQNLRACADKFLQDHVGRGAPDRAFALVRDLLAPHAAVPDVRRDLATLYLEAARWSINLRALDEAERWAAALRGLGGEHVEQGDAISRAIGAIRTEAEREEAEEHEEHEGGGERRPG